MSGFQPLAFEHLLRRAFYEFRREAKIFGLPSSRFWRGASRPEVELGVCFHGRAAGSPFGPAAGPHTQLAQNIVLSWLGGARFVELKTVQINDRLEIARPCIDAPNLGYNVEFSQELRLEQSLEEYVKAWMLVAMLEETQLLGVEKRRRGARQTPHFYDCVFDVSCGYDLAGIASEPMRAFLRALQDATPVIERLRAQIPDEFAELRRIDFEPRIVTTATLSTFHGCPPGEIEAIVEHLLREHGLHAVIKMNPTMLGKARLEQLLHEQLGYGELCVSPSALSNALALEEGVAMVVRLNKLAGQLGRQVGVKFSNTLEVLNTRGVLPSSEKVMYMSGPALYPLAMQLALDFRQSYARAGGDEEELPVSFSAGVDKVNFADCVSCGFLPVTVCTDLLKPGGYGRACEYLAALEEEMVRAGAATVEEYVRGRDAETCGLGRQLPQEELKTSALRNHARIAEAALGEARYARARNWCAPRRLDSELTLFDCAACERCVSVCPNAANFAYETAVTESAWRAWRVCAGGRLEPGEAGSFRLAKGRQIANFAPYCNACGNCETFCPERGGPYRKKPVFFADLETWMRERRDGFFVLSNCGEEAIFGRVEGVEYALRVRHGDAARHCFICPAGEVLVDPETLAAARGAEELREGEMIEMRVYLLLRTLLECVVHSPRVSFVNVVAGGALS